MRYLIITISVIFLVFYSLWNIYKEELKLWTYKWYMNNKSFIITKNISINDALTNCKQNSENNPNFKIRCTWRKNFTPISKEIYNNGN